MNRNFLLIVVPVSNIHTSLPYNLFLWTSMFFAKKEESEPPKRGKREQCWASRDAYFACLDKHDIINPLDPKNVKTAKKECGSEDKQFEKDCIASWVKYFKEKRPFDIKKERMLKEAAENGQEIVQMEGYRK